MSFMMYTIFVLCQSSYCFVCGLEIMHKYYFYCHMELTSVNLIFDTTHLHVYTNGGNDILQFVQTLSTPWKTIEGMLSSW